ncbi:6-carboxytetrahydropterin synthase [Paraneptunicella aestuarii]|uniref:6-carboxytetrahydropterin synthase n=1 Tax=Paraneptunicella aestuarii TaxID=2831148 RepID=UPI001E63A3CC|nr:6-carboxytetrahydropterin synthase [Paraneptunicella aestuarii]UAA40279.1 6-carboxytetrahydropterin synthase [Paraneptunicella aestuarii]
MQLFVNDLTVMDFSYLCPERGMVGESWIVDVMLDGALNEESMVLDFGRVKKDLKSLIDKYVDHKLLIPMEHPYTAVEHLAVSDSVKVHFNRPDKSIHLHCPDEAYAFIYSDTVTMKSVQEYLSDIIRTKLPGNVQGIELNLRAEVIETPFYHYTHGLKKHDGNCQRIAHGHRSRIDVRVDNQTNSEWPEYWAKRWQDIYIGTREDLVSECTLTTDEYTFLADGNHYLFSYESSQGCFELAIPTAECEIIETDSTVECLAQFMANEQKRLSPEHQHIVFAYEGVGKGAIAYA